MKNRKQIVTSLRMSSAQLKSNTREFAEAAAEGEVEMDYKIIETSSVAMLESSVREMIKDGWQPIGGLSVTQELCDATKHVGNNACTLYDAGFTYAQAMVKQEADDGEGVG